LTTYPADGRAAALLVLAHGAGAGQRHPFMVSMARGLAARGVDVATFDFAYMEQKRKVPDKAPALEARFREAVGDAQAWSTARHVFIGGKSMGGRIATHLAAHGDAVAGVVALGYPLHPPGRPEQPRTAHLPSIACPVLIVQGEQDTFGTAAELQPVVTTIGAPVTVHVVAGGDHSLVVRKRDREAVHAEVCDLVSNWIRSVVAAV
jgi:predicted alpha/beta-hydrolase family hydrolase